MQLDAVEKLVLETLENTKAIDIVSLDVAAISSMMSKIIIASGTSTRHAKSLANNVVVAAKKAGLQPLGVEGQAGGEWVLVDLGDVVVHLMQAEARDFYELEKLWGERAFDAE